MRLNASSTNKLMKKYKKYKKHKQKIYLEKDRSFLCLKGTKQRIYIIN